MPFTIFNSRIPSLPRDMPTRPKTKKQNDRFSLISREKLLALYVGLLRCGLLEKVVAGATPARRLLHTTSAAAAVAVCNDRLRGDVLIAPVREFLPAFVEGAGIKTLLSALGAPAAFQRAGYAARLRAGVASARKHRRNRSRRIVAVFHGAGADRQWQKLLRIAAVERLPIIFVSDDDSASQMRQIMRHLPTISVDRDDVVALYRVASESIAHARRGNGPTLIECVSWRAGDSAEPSDAVTRMEEYLAQRGISTARRKFRVTTEFGAKLNRSRHSARRSERPVQKRFY